MLKRVTTLPMRDVIVGDLTQFGFVTWLQLEGGGNNYLRNVLENTVSVAKITVFVIACFLLTGVRQTFHRQNRILHLAAVAAGVAVNCPAKTSRQAPRPFETGQACFDRSINNLLH